jgi:hypothetical protein
MSDTKNVKLGVCTVTFDGVDLGYTKGGVEVEVQTETKQVTVDQFGTSPINEYIMGRSVMARVPLAETTLENLVRIMPGSTLVATGGVKATGTITVAAGNASAADTITVNGKVYTFVSATPGVNDILIGTDNIATALNIKNKLAASVDSRVVQATYTVASNVVTVTYDDAGTVGNAFTLAKSGTNLTVSGATLSGGASATAKKVVTTNGIGVSLLEIAKKLVLRPLSASGPEEDFIIPLAMTPGALTYAYQFDNERVFNVQFMGYPDPVTKTLFIVGNEDAV